MNPIDPHILILNGGSSSIKFAMYRAGPPLTRVSCGKMDRIGMNGCTLTFNGPDGRPAKTRKVAVSDRSSAVSTMMDWIEEQGGFSAVGAVGHRVVHGMQHTAPERITSGLISELRRIEPFAPDHLPREIELIEAVQKRHPKLPQVACFDTSFHHDMPRVAKELPIPRRYEAKGIQRYGFHGLSYSFLMEELNRVAGAQAANGRVILAHLGNGASMAAVRDGRSMDTSMSFTPTSGLVMGTRSGDLDPGVASYLERTEQMSSLQFFEMVTHQSGMLGVSETSSDMRDLLARESEDSRAAEAVNLFCYQAKKYVGSFSAALGGLGTLVFAGGIGENAPRVRTRICENLRFIGIELNDIRNNANGAVISSDSSRVTVRVIHTDEEIMIARSTIRTLGIGGERPKG